MIHPAMMSWSHTNYKKDIALLMSWIIRESFCSLFLIWFKIWSRLRGFWNVLWDPSFACKLYCISYTWDASPRCASSCGFVDYQKKHKHSCTGHTCRAFPLCGSSSCDLSNEQFDCLKTRMLCICEAFLQSGFFCGSSDGLIQL